MRESKAERFRRVTEVRVNKAIKMIRLLGNCANPQTYAYDAAQSEKIFAALQDELGAAKERFSGAGKSSKKRFSLSDTSEPAENALPPQISMQLPDGTELRATAYRGTDYPSINIEWFRQSGEKGEFVCFAEFNPEKGSAGLLCIGAYRSDQDDTTYYEPYDAAEEMEV